MKYRTVKEVVEFLDGLRGEEVDDFALEIIFEFFINGRCIGDVHKFMYSDYTETSKEISEIINYRIESVVIRESGCRIWFEFNLVSPSSI